MPQKFLLFIFVSLQMPALLNAANWSRFITTQNRDDVKISFRQMRNNNAWSVEWQVNNTSNQTVETVLNKRHYLCDDDSTKNYNITTLGIYTAGSTRRGDIKDTGICPNSKIKLVEIETQIIAIKEIENHDKTSP